MSIIKIVLIIGLTISGLKLSATEKSRLSGSLIHHGRAMAGSVKLTVAQNQMILADDRKLLLLDCRLGSKGDFEISFDAPTRLSYIQMSVYDEKGKRIQLKELPFFGNFFLIESGADITVALDLDKGLISFEGKGSNVLRCQYELSSLNVSNFALNRLRKIPLAQSMPIDDQLQVSNLANVLALLKTYEEEIDIATFHRIRMDLVARQKYQYIRSKYITYDVEEIARRVLRANYFLASFVNPSSIFYPADSVAASPWYIEYLLERECILMLVGNGASGRPNMKKMYTSISENYTGVLRERLLLTFFITMARKHFSELRPLITLALATMSDSNIKTSLVDFNNDNQLGQDVFNFSFIDEGGKPHRLTDYRGKVLVLDFWFNGCHGCTQIPPLLQPIIDRFSDRKDVAFISVNVDKNRAGWLTGMKLGSYTCRGQVHLNTAGRGYDDDFLKAYYIKSYPRLFMIDRKGKLLSSSPVDPRIDGGKNILELIYKGIE